MMPTTFSKIVLTLGLMLNLAACQPKPLTEQERHTVTELTSKMQTHCAGRYLIDLPAGAVSYDSAKLQGVDVTIEPMSQQAFLDSMQKREAELKAMKSIDGYQFMYGDREYGFLDTSTEKLRKEGIWHFISLGEIDAADTRRIIEAYKWSNGYRIKLQTRTWDYRKSTSKDAKEMGNEVPQKLSQVLQMAHAFRGRTEDEIPTEPGVCLVGGFIAGAATDEERIDTKFWLNGTTPDIRLELTTDSSYQADTTLLQRGDQVKEILKERKGSTIRKGTVDLPGIPQAEEWLMSGITQSNIPGQHFALEATSLNGSAKTPIVMLDVDTGVFRESVPKANRTKTSLTEGEALGLWDAVSRSLRPRPNGF